MTEELTWRYLNLFYDAADYVTTPTPESVDIIKRNGCIAPMEAVSSGIDLSMIGASKTEEMKRKYNLGDKVVLYIGRISFGKNIGGLIDAFDIVHKRIPDAQLLLVGDGPKLDYYKEYVQEKSCRDNIIFTGLIPHQELPDSGLIKNAKLFATMSGTETQGITILEVQANELISVGVPEGGLVDLIKDGENGFMAETGNSEDMADKICHVLENHEYLQHMKNKALEMALSHDLVNVIDRWEEIYQDLIDKNRQGLLERKKPLRFRNLLNFAREFKLDNEYFKKRFGLSF